MAVEKWKRGLRRGAVSLVLAVGFALWGVSVAVAQSGGPPSSADQVGLGPTLWGNVRSGMTLADVRKLVPESHAAAKQDSLFGVRARKLLEAIGSLRGRPSQVRFYFSDAGRLVAVVEAIQDPALNYEDVSKIADAINAKYGFSQECRIDKDELIGGCSWVGKSLKISMAESIVPEKFKGVLSSSFVSLEYRALQDPF